MLSGSHIVALILALLLACAVMYRTNRQREEARRVQQLKEAFGKIPDKHMRLERYAKVPAYYLRHKADQVIDDITWNDLDLDALYHRIDAAQSAAGEEYLYYLLRTPAQDEAQSRELLDAAAVRYFADTAHETQRVRLQQILAGLGHTGKYSLYDYLDRLDELGERRNLRNYLCCLLPFVCIGIMAIQVQAGIGLLIAAICYNMVTYYRERGEIDPYLVSFRYLLRLIDASKALCRENLDALQSDIAQLERANAALDGFRAGSGIVMSHTELSAGNPADLLLDYIRILFHLDLIKFNTMLQTVRVRRTEIDEMLRIVGRIDACIAVSSFRQSLAYSCDPVWMPTGMPPALKVRRLIHPLLDAPVANSVDADSPILLTGSNASGKSTFLKSMAIAALLAQTLGFVPAEEYVAPRWRIYTSMALRDSMQNGDSYFMVEIKSLKRIVDAASIGTANPVLCCIDEVLRGTNTIERIAASSEILEHLAESGHVLCIAATHDLELTDLLPRYENYHFEETLQGEDVTFSYKIQSGRARSRNAIRLLTQIGFDVDITEMAEARAERFEASGKWQFTASTTRV